MFKKNVPFLAGLLLLLVICGCHKEQPVEPLRFTGKTMGTSWSVVLIPSADVDTSSLQQALQHRLDQINHQMSTYDPASEISLFNQQQSTDWFEISAQTARVVALSLDISRLTAGAFDISVGPLIDLWGFGPTARGRVIPTQDQISQRLASVGYHHLQLRMHPVPALKKAVGALRIDLSAVAKGFAVDELANLLSSRGIENYLIEVGGELQVAGLRADKIAWRIAIEKPLEDRREVETVIPLTNTALATSGNYRNFYIEDGQRYAHTIDPLTGRPIRHKLASVTVLDSSCARADALATALMVLGEVKGRELVEQHQLAVYFMIHERNQLDDYASPAFIKIAEKNKR